MLKEQLKKVNVLPSNIPDAELISGFVGLALSVRVIFALMKYRKLAQIAEK